jgi:hypothetical protein
MIPSTTLMVKMTKMLMLQNKRRGIIPEVPQMFVHVVTCPTHVHHSGLYTTSRNSHATSVET